MSERCCSGKLRSHGAQELESPPIPSYERPFDACELSIRMLSEAADRAAMSPTAKENQRMLAAVLDLKYLGLSELFLGPLARRGCTSPMQIRIGSMSGYQRRLAQH